MRLLNRYCAGATLAVGLLTGCPDRQVSEVNPSQDKAELKEVPVNINRKVDILFVIDDSGSMGDEQANLIRNFPEFIEVLQTIEGGLPDVHIGVVSTNVGAGSTVDMNCPLNGDDGRLRFASGCRDMVSGDLDYLKSGGDDANVDAANLANAFSCIAELGVQGCGFEQPLESMRRALEPGTNGDFIRQDAFLAVILLTDEDDCSASNDDIFRAPLRNEPGDPVFDELGARASLRCFEFGVKCDTGGRDVGPRENCDSEEESEYFYPVDEYVQFLKDLKGTGTQDDAAVIVAGIYGLDIDTLLPEPVRIGTEPPSSEIELLPVCEVDIQGGTSTADPGIRVKRFIDAFPDRNTSTTICDNDLSDALVLIGELLKKAIGNPCIEGNLKDVNPDVDGAQYECAVSYVTNPGAENQTEQIIPPCTATGGEAPCWEIITDPGQCPEAPNLKMDVKPGASVPPNTVERTQCVVSDDPAPV
jgi:hypothetical protein